MDRTDFLCCLQAFTEAVVKDSRLPVRYQKSDPKKPEPRTPAVYKMHIPDASSAMKKAPYILHQIVAGKDQQKPGEQKTASTVTVRTIFCVYSEDEQEGGMLLLELMERLRIALLKKRTLASRYALDMESALECLCYPEDTAPYFAGEMASVWRLPGVEREVPNWL